MEPDRPAELGRLLRRAVKVAKPRIERFVTDAKPRVGQARDDAVKYAREHDEEIKQLASRLVRARMTGPLGLVVEAFASQAVAPPAEDKRIEGTCKGCGVTNPKGARFCNQCGAALQRG
jgi:hypothetical protein